MWKYLIGLPSLLLACALPAHACDLSLERRSPAVADYVHAASPCLLALPSGYFADRNMELGFLTHINNERASSGLSPVTLRQELTSGARFHSLDMSANKFFGHSGPDERHPIDRISAFDRRAFFDYASENVAMMEVLQGHLDLKLNALDHLHGELMNSPPHQQNILNPDATHVAIGVIRTDKGVWVTQLFLGLVGTLDQDAPLRLSAGEPINFNAKISDWTVKNFEAEQANQPAKVFRTSGVMHKTPDDLQGDFRLSAYSERKGAKPRTTYSIHFAGPSISTDR